MIEVTLNKNTTEDLGMSYVHMPSHTHTKSFGKIYKYQHYENSQRHHFTLLLVKQKILLRIKLTRQSFVFIIVWTIFRS